MIYTDATLYFVLDKRKDHGYGVGMETGKIIKDFRRKFNLTQQEAADMLATNRANISNYETNRVEPPAKILGKIILLKGILLLPQDAENES